MADAQDFSRSGLQAGLQTQNRQASETVPSRSLGVAVFEGVAAEVGSILSSGPCNPIRERVRPVNLCDPPTKDLPQTRGQVQVGPNSVPVSVGEESDSRQAEATIRALVGQPDCKVAPNHLR